MWIHSRKGSPKRRDGLKSVNMHMLLFVEAMRVRRWLKTAVLALSFWQAVCSTAAAQGADVSHPLDAHLTERYTGDLGTLRERKYIRVLTAYNRTNFFLENGRLHGFEYALLQAFQKHLNKSVSRKELRIILEFIPVSRGRLIPDLVDGYGDIAAAGLTVTPGREERIDFTDPYLTGIDEVLVMHSSLPPVHDAVDLSGQRILVHPSSSYHDSLLTLNRQLERQGKPAVRIIRADENLETEDILELVNSGAVGRTVCDSHIADLWADILPDIRVYRDVTLRRDASIGWAVRETNPALKASLNRFIESHRKGTRLGNIYFERYYENTTWIKNPMDSGAGKRLAALTPLFKKYAARYGFDWLMIAAMAYQESGFDQKKTSPRGAVGIMQIRPETAADPKVGIRDVTTVENNIHAAVKYLDFLRKRYFSDAAVLPRNQVRFSLAAYNAGPVKIRKARELAAKMRLDPNQWFRNVEVAMLKIVGQETVRYVSNVNKYYVIYSYSVERLGKREAAMKRLER